MEKELERDPFVYKDGPMTSAELVQKALHVKNAEIALDIARRKRAKEEANLWLETDWASVGAKLAKEKEIYVRDQLDPYRKEMHEAEADLALLNKLYEIAYIQYQKEE